MENLNINLRVKYHDWMGEIYFEDNFIKLKDDTWLYTDWGNLPEKLLSEIVPEIKYNKSNEKKLARFIYELNYSSFDTIKYVYDNLTLDEMIEYLEEYFNGLNYHELEEIFDKSKVTYTSEYIQIETRGYSQSDFEYVWVNVKDFERIFGSKPVEEELQKTIDNLFWDTPICGHIEISFDYTVDNIKKRYDETIDILEVNKSSYDVKIDGDWIIKSLKKEVRESLSNQDKQIIIDKLESYDYMDIGVGDYD